MTCENWASELCDKFYARVALALLAAGLLLAWLQQWPVRGGLRIRLALAAALSILLATTWWHKGWDIGGVTRATTVDIVDELPADAKSLSSASALVQEENERLKAQLAALGTGIVLLPPPAGAPPLPGPPGDFRPVAIYITPPPGLPANTDIPARNAAAIYYPPGSVVRLTGVANYPDLEGIAATTAEVHDNGTHDVTLDSGAQVREACCSLS